MFSIGTMGIMAADGIGWNWQNS